MNAKQASKVIVTTALEMFLERCDHVGTNRQLVEPDCVVELLSLDRDLRLLEFDRGLVPVKSSRSTFLAQKSILRL